jgi:hypothetical protein
MSDAVIVALIGLVGTVVSIVLTSRVNNKVNSIGHQVKNDHSSNLRDDIDGVHQAVERVADIQRTHGLDIRGLRSDIGELRGADRQLRREFEDTIPRHKLEEYRHGQHQNSIEGDRRWSRWGPDSSGDSTQ